MANISLIKTANELVSDVLTNISGVDSAAGRLTDYDLRKITAIDPHAVEMSKLTILLDYLQKAQSINGFREILISSAYVQRLQAALGYNSSTGRTFTYNEVRNMIIVDLEDYAKNFQIRRTASVKATGTVYAINQSGNRIRLPLGTLIKTTEGIYFEVTSAVDDPNPSYFSSSSLSGYATEVPVRAVIAGNSGNVPAYSIRYVEGVENVNRCINLNATSGGSPQEDLQTFMSRVTLAWQGRNFPTKGGYYSYLAAKDEVYDVLVRMPYDNLMFREGTDIWVYAEEQAPAAEAKYYYTGEDIVLAHQPVVSITSIIGSKTYYENVDFNLIIDAGSMGRSSSGRDKIRFIDGMEPANEEALTIQYVYNKEITDLQTDLFAESNRELNNQVLVKWAYKIPIDISIRYKLLPGYVASEVETEMATYIGSYFTGNSAGTVLRKIIGYHTAEVGSLYRNCNIQQSDIIAIIEATEGVDYVVIPLTSFIRQPQTRTARFATGLTDITTVQSETTSESVIVMDTLEYGALGTLTMTSI